MVHYKGSDDYTCAEQDIIIMQLEDFLWVDPEYLLPQDRGLLDEGFCWCYVDRGYGDRSLRADEHSRRSDTDKLRRRLRDGKSHGFETS